MGRRFRADTSIMLLVLSLLSAVFAQSSDGSWPPLDKVPPTVDAWSQQFLTPNAGIPDVEVRKSRLSKLDWTPDITACTDSMSWGVSYDDGPSVYTPQILDYLDQTGSKATFFIVGSRLADNAANRDTLLRAYNAGHQIAIHTWSHSPISTQTNDEIVAEVIWTGQIIRNVTGVFPRYFRPPYGDIEPRSRAVLKSMGLEVVVWNADTNDWNLQTYPHETHMVPSDVQKRVSEYIKSPPVPGMGIVSLEHDIFKYSAGQAVPSLQLILGAGYKVMPIADCMSGPPKYFEGPNGPLSGDAAVTIAANISVPTTPVIANTSTLVGTATSAIVNSSSTATDIITAIPATTISAPVALITTTLYLDDPDKGNDTNGEDLPTGDSNDGWSASTGARTTVWEALRFCITLLMIGCFSAI